MCRIIESYTDLFQSLFSWSYLSKIGLPSLFSGPQSSFNPYFPGVTFQRQESINKLDELFKFQSLFSWSYLSKLLSFPVM